MKKSLAVLAMAIGMVFSAASIEVANMEWMTDYNTAVKTAAEKKLPVLMLFTGSDWCPYCVRLERNILSKPEFQNYAKDNVVLLYIDFPNKKAIDANQLKANRELAKKYNISGYPTVVMIDAEGKTLGKSFHGTRNAADFVTLIKAAIAKQN